MYHVKEDASLTISDVDQYVIIIKLLFYSQHTSDIKTSVENCNILIQAFASRELPTQGVTCPSS
jgi:hypothetical protein